MPGVHAVLTHADVPGAKTYGLEFPDQPVLAIDRVRYFGEPVALVAAEHPEQARRAAEAIRVEYELLEPVVDPERATEQEPLHPTARRWGTATATTRARTSSATWSSATAIPDAEGDVDGRGRLRDRDARTRRSSGPSPGLAVPDGEGGVDIYVATQWLHVDRDQVAPCLGLQPEQVRIHLAGVGGAFGGREDLSMQIHGAMLALHTDRPVKIVYNREESFVGHVHRHPAKIWAEHRATRDGRLVCVRMRDPARRRRLRLQLDGGHRRTRRRSPPARTRSTNALIESHRRLHEQPALRRDARLRRRADVLRRRGADGQARRGARHRPGRAAAAERARPGRHAAHRPGDHRLAADGGGDPARRRDPGARSRRSCRAIRSASPAAPATRPAARASGAASASPSGSRTSATRRASTTPAPRACSCRRRRQSPRSTARRPRSGRAWRDVILQVARTELGIDDVALAPARRPRPSARPARPPRRA